MVGDASITIGIGLLDHVLKISLREGLAKALDDLTELGNLDVSISILIEHLEGLADLLIGIQTLHLVLHQLAELVKVDGSIAWKQQNRFAQGSVQAKCMWVSTRTRG